MFFLYACQLHHDLETLHLRHGRVIDTAFLFPAKFYGSNKKDESSKVASKDDNKKSAASAEDIASSNAVAGSEIAPMTPPKEKFGEMEQRKRLPPSLPLRFLVHVILEGQPVSSYDPDDGNAPEAVGAAAVPGAGALESSKEPASLHVGAESAATTTDASEKKKRCKAEAPELDADGWEIVTPKPPSRSKRQPTPPSPPLPLPAPVPVASLPLPHDSLEDAQWALALAQGAAAAWNNGSLADAAAHMQAPHLWLPSRPRGVGLRNIPPGAAPALAQWAAVCAQGATRQSQEQNQKTGGTQGAKHKDKKLEQGGGSGGGGGKVVNVRPLGLTPPCYGFVQLLPADTTPEKTPLAAAPSIDKEASPLLLSAIDGNNDDGDQAAHSDSCTPAIAAKAALVFESTPARDRWFEHALLSLGAASQVRLWPLPPGIHWSAVATALEAIGLGPVKYVKVAGSRAKKSNEAASPSQSSLDAPAAFVSFRHRRHAYQALGLTFPEAYDPETLLEQPAVPLSMEAPKDHRLRVVLGGKGVMLSATLPRVDDFKASVPGVPGQIHFTRR